MDNPVLGGCQGHSHTPEIIDRICPTCGAEMEIFSTEATATCDKCGTVIYNDKISCAMWCKYAKECFGEETYNNLMIIGERKKAEADKKRAEQKAMKEVKNNE
ncbi:MAG: hypothetical protein KBS43_02680 [Oscillospiraceae bacterium]|nr:hypothetical protein [Candidatus Limimonas coprohippi]